MKARCEGDALKAVPITMPPSLETAAARLPEPPASCPRLSTLLSLVRQRTAWSTLLRLPTPTTKLPVEDTPRALLPPVVPARSVRTWKPPDVQSSAWDGALLAATQPTIADPSVEMALAELFTVPTGVASSSTFAPELVQRTALPTVLLPLSSGPPTITEPSPEIPVG